MEIYLIIVGLLFILAASDLVVGVSNDAVNFLNSALGSKVASRRTIMIVVSLGILAGVTFASGMMEVARKGIFNPQFYYFDEVMFIFLAVMITDIFLLDLFNTFGMPTSTTVSIVFELLGAAVAMALLKVINEGDPFDALTTYINWSSAGKIIMSILMSVAIAFVVGALVQYISRFLFTYNYTKKLKSVGIIWSGMAFTLLTYFLLFKGLKGASFVTSDFLHWMKENLAMLLGVSFVCWTLVMAGVHYLLKANVLRLVVLFGTFSLAMAFAGNDLVNFIGVPMAGLESYKIWMATSIDPSMLSMEALSRPVRTDTYLLLLAGGIMIVTLWFSKKARSVTETEINLGRMDEGTEKFSSNLLARGIVRYSLKLGLGLERMLPASFLAASQERFSTAAVEVVHDGDPPAFDLVRASVNLTIASMLIALATSLKLPLSTTYVSFMVAMGTSLADRAWGRDSAVFRVSGVVNVIGGWFATAGIAFVVSALIVSLLYYFGIYAVVALVLLLLFIVARTAVLHRKSASKKEELKAFQKEVSVIDKSTMQNQIVDYLYKCVDRVARIYDAAMQALIEEDTVKLKLAQEELQKLKSSNEDFENKMFHTLKRLEEGETLGRTYLQLYDVELDLIQSIEVIVNGVGDHVQNFLKPLDAEQNRSLTALKDQTVVFLSEFADCCRNGHVEGLRRLSDDKDKVVTAYRNQTAMQISGIQKGKFGARSSMLLFTIDIETTDILESLDHLMDIMEQSH